MTIEQQWNRFIGLVRRQAPRPPSTAQSQAERDRAAAGRAVAAGSALLDGLDEGLPGPVGLAASAATANSPVDAANATVDAAVSAGAQHVAGGIAGPLVGNFIALARGTYQSLDRGDQMVIYLLGTGGYVDALARLTVNAVHEAVPYTRPLTTLVPSYIDHGAVFSAWRRRAWVDGVRRATAVVREMDTVRPLRGDHYSKRVLIQLGLLTGRQGFHGSRDSWRLRQAAEQVILGRILGRDMAQERERLRRWANAA